MGIDEIVLVLGIVWIIVGVGAELIGSILSIILKNNKEEDERLDIFFFIWNAYTFLFEIFYLPF
jgi:hypothetical protein